MMKRSNEELVIVKLLKQAVEAEGCELAQVDFENKILKLKGPDEVVPDCARAVAEIME
jgi:hypothetical protein